jgi:hypothetical protein
MQQFSITVTRPPRFGWQWVRRKLMLLVKSPSTYSLLDHHPILSTALELERLVARVNKRIRHRNRNRDQLLIELLSATVWALEYKTQVPSHLSLTPG